MNNCWLTKKDMDCDEACFECGIMREVCSIVVFCSVEECLHWKELPETYVLKHNKNYVPFEDTKYAGVCARGEIGVGSRRLVTPLAQYNIAECKCKSNKNISGHMDFTRHLRNDGTPKGENIG